MPFKSEAQRRKFHVLYREGKISKATLEKWERETRNVLKRAKRRMKRRS